MNDSLWLYENDDEDENWPHPNPLQRERGLRYRGKPTNFVLTFTGIYGQFMNICVNF